MEWVSHSFLAQKLDMESLGLLASLPHSLCLFIAPPAWGKTQMLKELLDQGISMVYFAPLRALAEEFSASVGKRGKLVRTQAERKEALDHFSKKREASILIMTPEVFGDSLDELNQLSKEFLVILDEVHLFFRWGLSFRPALWDLLLGLLSYEFKVWGLTATVDAQMEEELKELIPYFPKSAWRIDLGNMRLRYPPTKIFRYPDLPLGREVFRRRLLELLERLDKEKRPGSVLLFVPYRTQVDQWLVYLKRKGISVLGCVGGEVGQFVNRLDLHHPPRCIVSTTALSHGVNLPGLHSIFIYQKLKDPSFYIQMVGRGGRKGESYELHTFDMSNQEEWSRWERTKKKVKDLSFLAIHSLFTL